MNASRINHRFKLLLSIVLLCSLLTACPSTKPTQPLPPPPPPPPTVVINPANIPTTTVQSAGQIALSAGIELYNNGQYQMAIKKLQTIVDNTNEDFLTQTNAYKYISFSLCVLGRKAACRENFEKLLRLNPSFDLTQAEAGHPNWGPVFKQAKATVLK
jgi:tetratricopeptide (TPR) repeat protein